MIHPGRTRGDNFPSPTQPSTAPTPLHLVGLGISWRCCAVRVTAAEWSSFGSPSPADRALTIASARLATCNLAKMFEMWLPTVLGAKPSRLAIAALPNPLAISVSTSRHEV